MLLKLSFSRLELHRINNRELLIHDFVMYFLKQNVVQKVYLLGIKNSLLIIRSSKPSKSSFSAFSRFIELKIKRKLKTE
jgi:hypothetical protein